LVFGAETCITVSHESLQDTDHPDTLLAIIPEEWLREWSNPGVEFRPLQIVHGIDPRRVQAAGVEQMIEQDGASRSSPQQIAQQGMGYFLQLGLGGIVCNVSFNEYLRSGQHWQTLIMAVEQCEKLGMIVWIYDEQGYPSGAAGGLVLAENPDFEAQVLSFRRGSEPPFFLRRAYEHTHASNNYYAARRYANLLDDRAVASFIRHTHEAYANRLKTHFGKTIQAFFTDEPSTMAVNLGQIPEPARSRVPVVDPVNPQVEPLPTVPWCYDLPEQYRRRYGEDLMTVCRSLFEGNAPEDKRIRRQFWALIADLIAERYFGALQDWCGRHGVASSGHTLHEESPLHHVPLEGNALKVLARMDIPGLDMLTSNPRAATSRGWLTAGLPSSAARLTGRRRVMTEVSDFAEEQAKEGPAKLDQMRAAAGWQAAWGVTDFTLYYRPQARPLEEYRAYNDFVGRLNAILKSATPVASVLLYYPIYDLWEEYLPVAEPLRLEQQSPRAQQIVRSFWDWGRRLTTRQIPFTLVDHEYLAKGKVHPKGAIELAGMQYTTLIIPDMVDLPPKVRSIVQDFEQQGGQVLHTTSKTDDWISRIKPSIRLEPANDAITLGRFERGARQIFLLVNLTATPYKGRLVLDLDKGSESLTDGPPWAILRPSDGSFQIAKPIRHAELAIDLAPFDSLLLICKLPE